MPGVLSLRHDRPGEGALQIIALTRIGTGVIFLFLASYKVFGDSFPRIFEQFVDRAVNQHQAIPPYGAFLGRLVAPHVGVFEQVIGWGELLIGIGLVAGLFVPLVSIAGALHMTSLMLATWNTPGPGAPGWRYVSAQLDRLPLLFLFVIFAAARAGQTWGLDRWRLRS